MRQNENKKIKNKNSKYWQGCGTAGTLVQCLFNTTTLLIYTYSAHPTTLLNTCCTKYLTMFTKGYTILFIAARILIAKTENDSKAKYPSIVEWINKVCCIHTIDTIQK